MCSLQSTQWDYRVAPYVVVGFVDLISREIRRFTKDLSTQLNRFLRAPRNRRTFVAKASNVAYHLGLTFKAAVPLHAGRQARHDAVCAMAIFSVPYIDMLTIFRAQSLQLSSLALMRCWHNSKALVRGLMPKAFELVQQSSQWRCWVFGSVFTIPARSMRVGWKNQLGLFYMVIQNLMPLY